MLPVVTTNFQISKRPVSAPICLCLLLIAKHGYDLKENGRQWWAEGQGVAITCGARYAGMLPSREDSPCCIMLPGGL